MGDASIGSCSSVCDLDVAKLGGFRPRNACVCFEVGSLNMMNIASTKPLNGSHPDKYHGFEDQAH